MKIKQEKGVVGIDISTGIIIFVIASTTILALYYQIFIHMGFIKVHEAAVACITEAFEDIDLKNYDEVSTNSQIDEIIKSTNLPSSYKYEINVSHYSENNDLPDDKKSTIKDIVEKINVKITYTLAGTTKSFEMNKIKIKE